MEMTGTVNEVWTGLQQSILIEAQASPSSPVYRNPVIPAIPSPPRHPRMLLAGIQSYNFFT